MIDLNVIEDTLRKKCAKLGFKADTLLSEDYKKKLEADLLAMIRSHFWNSL